MSTILVVEDAPIIREPLVRLLLAEGFETLAAANGFEALTLLRAEESHVDLILLDVWMPRMNGVAFLQTLRAENLAADAPVLALTGIEDSASRSRLRELGVAEILDKGRFQSAALLQEIRRQLAQVAALRSS